MNGSDRLKTALSDRYRIERQLGAGGMATVYLAHDLKHDREVAIKVVHQELAAALGGERFLAEIKTTAKLQHPHILPLLDSGEADGLRATVTPSFADAVEEVGPEADASMGASKAPEPRRTARRTLRAGVPSRAAVDAFAPAGAARSMASRTTDCRGSTTQVSCTPDAARAIVE